MADNSGTFQTSAIASPPSGLNPALRQLSLSGDTVEVQVIVPVATTGSEGSWTAREYLLQDDAAFTPGTNAVAMMGAEFDDTGPDSVDEGDAGALRMSARRELYVQIRDAAGNERGLNVDGSGNITVNVTGTVTVGSHAVTNAGTFAVQVDGAALTALQLIDNIVYAEDAGHSSGESGAFVLGIRNANRATFAGTELDYSGLAVDGSGRVIITGQTAHDGPTGDVPVIVGGYASAAAPSDVSADADAVRAWYLRNGAQAVNLTAAGALIPGSAADGLTVNLGTNNDVTVTSGTVDLGATDNAVLDAIAASVAAADTDLTTIIGHVDGIEGLLTTIDADTGSILTAVQLIDNPVLVDDAAFTPATSSVMMAGFEADETATDSVDEGDAGAARMTLDRKQITTLYPHTAGGLSVAQLNGADSGGGVLVATAQVIKASAGQMYGYYVYNPNSSATFVHFYNVAAASVTVGTTAPLMSITIPATSAANLALPYGIAFSNAGWSAAATTTAGGNTAPSTGLDVTVFYI